MPIKFDLLIKIVYNNVMKKIIAIIFINISIMTMLFTGCNNYVAYTFDTLYFNCATKIILDKNQKTSLSYNNMIKEVESQLKFIDETVSSTKENSDVYKFNNLKKHNSIEISELTKKLIELSINYYSFTKGAFNIACYPLTNIWGLSSETYGKTEFTPPLLETIETTLKYTDLNNIELSGNTLKKLNYDEVKIDLGGIAKGYAIDIISSLLKEKGFTKGYVNIGTSSMRLMDYEKQWNLQIKNPREENNSDVLLEYKIKNASLSTSGDYERYHLYEGNRYCHIINPLTGRPIETNIMSVTVIGDNAVFTDMITTALMTYEIEDSIKFIKDNLNDYKVFLTYEIEKNNYTLYTNINEKEFSLKNKNYNIINIFQ